MLTPEEIARLLELEPLPGEGGMYRQTYIRGGAAGGPPASTAIYYLLTDRLPTTRYTTSIWATRWSC